MPSLSSFTRRESIRMFEKFLQKNRRGITLPESRDRTGLCKAVCLKYYTILIKKRRAFRIKLGGDKLFVWVYIPVDNDFISLGGPKVKIERWEQKDQR